MCFQLKKKEKKKIIIAVFIGFLLIKSRGIVTIVSTQEISENVEVKTTSGAAIIETPTKNLEPIIEQPVIENEKKLEITGEITPWIIAEDKDITSIEMNKIIFPLNDTSNSEGEEIVEKEKTVSLEQIYTLNVKSKGGLYLALASADQVPFQSLQLQIYADSTLKKKIGKDYIMKADTKVIKNKSYYLSKAGTYYLRFTYNRSLETEEDTIENSKVFGMTAAFLYSNNRTLQEGKSLVSYADAKKRAIYYKVNIKKDGLISYLAMPEDGTSLLSGYIQLCDEEKEPVSVSEYVSNSEDNNQAVHAYYAVKKGTYYIKAELNTSYIANFTLEKVKDISGSSMERAKKLKLGGKEKKSVIFLSDQLKKEKWFCFRLKKNQNFSIVVNSCINGYLNIEVCNADRITVKSGSINFHTGTKILKTSAKWQRGIYYIKISKEKKSLKSSGYFSIKVED